MVAVHFEHVDAKTRLATCAFLGTDHRCTIYDDRPFPCRDFGTECSPMMVCSWMDKTGRVRPRAERREIEKARAADVARARERLTAMARRTP